MPIKTLLSFVANANKYVCLIYSEKGNLVCGSKPNPRKLFFHVHKKSESFYNSKKNILVQDDLVGVQKKDEIDEAVINCIIQDGSRFNDFHKPGM